jgi:hypothetical protein
LRSEVPWVDRTPAEIFRDHFRLTIQPLDAPDSADTIARAIDHLRSDELLLFSSDYPHWQFDGDEILPKGLSPELGARSGGQSESVSARRRVAKAVPVRCTAGSADGFPSLNSVHEFNLPEQLHHRLDARGRVGGVAEMFVDAECILCGA